jgi:hypothetical protein
MIQYKFVVKLLAAFAVFSMLSVITGNAAIGDLNAASKTISGNARSVAAPSVQWEQTFGGSVGNSTGRRVQQTTDGGYIIVGTTTSFGAGNARFYLVKTDSSGKKQWEQTFGGSVGNSTGRGVQQTTDGGYIIVGQTNSFSAGKLKAYLVKTDSSGSMQWQQTYGGNALNFGAFVQQTTDGGYIFVGSTVADRTLLAYLVKTDSSGTMQWEKTFGGPYGQNGGASVRQTTDGGYIIAGSAIQSRNQNYAYLAKTDSSGSMQWEKTFGGKGVTLGMSVQQTKDSGYVIGGATNSSGAGKQEFYLVKTDSSGTKQWEQMFGGNGDDIAYAVQQTNDGGYIMGGTDSLTAANRTQTYLVKTDSSGSMQWQETFSGNGDSSAYDVQQTNDGGYIVVGSTYPGHAGLLDVYLAKL